MKLHSNPSTQKSRAAQIWLILISKANNRQTITYTNLGKYLGPKYGPNVLPQILFHVEKYCQDNKLPILTSLVVSDQTGVPTKVLVSDHNLEMEKVFKHDWFDIEAPREADF